MKQIGILLGILAAGGEPHLPVFHIHLEDFAHHPFALGDLVLDLALFGVDQVEVPPTVQFRHVDDFTGGVEVLQIESVAATCALTRRSMVDHRFRFFIPDEARLPRPGLDFHNAETEVAAVGLFKSEMRTLFIPSGNRG